MPEQDNGIASFIPLNARTFLRNLMRDEGDTSSLLQAGDFSAEQIEEIYRQVEEQDRINAEDEATQVRSRDALENIVADPSSHFVESEDLGFPEGSETLSKYTARVQGYLDEASEKVASYEAARARGETQVRGFSQERDSGRDPEGIGPGVIDVIKKAFTSPAYNIGTTLHGYTAFKNEDGTVTVKDKYNWTGQSDDPEGEINISLPDFLAAIPTMIQRPEAMGNVLMRTVFKDKYSPVDVTLPPRQGDTVEMPEGYRKGGRVRLI